MAMCQFRSKENTMLRILGSQGGPAVRAPSMLAMRTQTRVRSSVTPSALKAVKALIML